MDDPVNTPEFWEACYESEMDGWDLGGPTPVFQRLASELPKELNNLVWRIVDAKEDVL